MRNVTATCPICGNVTLPADRYTLTVVNVPGRSWFAWDCHGERVQRPASHAIIVKLMATEGMNIVKLMVPPEALEEHDGPPLTDNDVLDFMNSLGHIDSVADLDAA